MVSPEKIHPGSAPPGEGINKTSPLQTKKTITRGQAGRWCLTRTSKGRGLLLRGGDSETVLGLSWGHNSWPRVIAKFISTEANPDKVMKWMFNTHSSTLWEAKGENIHFCKICFWQSSIYWNSWAYRIFCCFCKEIICYLEAHLLIWSKHCFKPRRD